MTDGEVRAERAYRAARTGYDRGLIDLQIHPLTAEQSWRVIRAQLTAAQVQALRRSVQAYKAIGGGWPAQGLRRRQMRRRMKLAKSCSLAPGSPCWRSPPARSRRRRCPRSDQARAVRVRPASSRGPSPARSRRPAPWCPREEGRGDAGGHRLSRGPRAWSMWATTCRAGQTAGAARPRPDRSPDRRRPRPRRPRPRTRPSRVAGLDGQGVLKPGTDRPAPLPGPGRAHAPTCRKPADPARGKLAVTAPVSGLILETQRAARATCRPAARRPGSAWPATARSSCAAELGRGRPRPRPRRPDRHGHACRRRRRRSAACA